MKLYANSFSKTIDAVNEAFFFKRPISPVEREKAAAIIAGRQGLPNSYAEMFAPMPSEMESGIRLFTGEALKPSASLQLVTGVEGCRALTLLKPQAAVSKAALKKARIGMLKRLRDVQPNKHSMFCCGTCDPALWRFITVGGLPGEERWLASGMKALKAHRDDKGRWRRFPFFHTLFALSEIDLPAALREMKYAAPVCEKYLARTKPSNRINDRKQTLIERVLDLC